MIRFNGAWINLTRTPEYTGECECIKYEAKPSEVSHKPCNHINEHFGLPYEIVIELSRAFL